MLLLLGCMLLNTNFQKKYYDTVAIDHDNEWALYSVLSTTAKTIHMSDSLIRGFLIACMYNLTHST